jgi:hypothetical protein
MTTASVQFDRLLERITTHLRELIARLQIELIRRWCRALVSNQNGGVVPPIASPLDSRTAHLGRLARRREPHALALLAGNVPGGPNLCAESGAQGAAVAADASA